MLVLTRKQDQVLIVGDARILFTKTERGRVRIAIDAPASVKVLRGEVAGRDPKPESPQTKDAA